MPIFHNIHFLQQNHVRIKIYREKKNKDFKTDSIHNITNKSTIPRIKRHAFQFPVFLLLAGFLWMSTVPSCVNSSSAIAIFQALFCLLFKIRDSPTKSSKIRARIRVNHDNFESEKWLGALDISKS